MKKMQSSTLGAVALALAALASSACQDHFSTQDAYVICQDLSDKNPATNPQGSFDDCVACYETCGGDCEQTGTSPETYVCPDELGEGGGAAGGAGAGGGA